MKALNAQRAEEALNAQRAAEARNAQIAAEEAKRKADEAYRIRREIALAKLATTIAELQKKYNDDIIGKDGEATYRLSDELIQAKKKAQTDIQEEYNIRLTFNNKYMIGGGYETSEDIEFNNNLLSATSDEDTLYKHLTKKSHKRNMKIRGTRKL
jgi:hypothetical protein